MDITQAFYNSMAPHYDKLFYNWTASTRRHAALLDKLFRTYGFDPHAQLLDCACGIGTQSIGLASLGYRVTASDLSGGALAEARQRAAAEGVQIRFEQADFRALSEIFPERFDIVIAMDNALPHMLTGSDLKAAVESIVGRITPGGIFVASIRDYDRLLAEKPSFTPPYIHQTEKGQHVSFQTWSWKGENYQFTQYLIDDEDTLRIDKFVCEYRATRRDELTALLLDCGCVDVQWRFQEDTEWYQPVVIARK